MGHDGGAPARQDRYPAGNGPVLDGERRTTYLLTTLRAMPDCASKAAVLTNMVGVIVDGRPEDFETAAALTGELGHRRVAADQDELDRLLGTGPRLPYTTAAISTLANTPHIQAALLAAGRSTTDSDQVAIACADAASWLLMTGMGPPEQGPIPTTYDELRRVVEQRGAATWRRVLARATENPWGPAVTLLLNLTRAPDLPAPASTVGRCVQVVRHKQAESERREVAREVRRLVAVSGCTQREFAALIGTSAPRLSTYVSGGVTPSATMMLRIRSQSEALTDRRDQTRMT